MFGLLIWSRPYERRSGNNINIFIQVVRVLSVVCILVFVEELGIAQTTKTITGVILIAVQSALTGLLAILIAVNAIISCCRQNPHRKRRKEAGENQKIQSLPERSSRANLTVQRNSTVTSILSLLLMRTTLFSHIQPWLPARPTTSRASSP